MKEPTEALDSRIRNDFINAFVPDHEKMADWFEAYVKDLLLEARKETAQHIKDICPVTDGASADRLHSRIDNYLEELQGLKGN